jgi:hypothetical protein
VRAVINVFRNVNLLSLAEAPFGIVDRHCGSCTPGEKGSQREESFDLVTCCIEHGALNLPVLQNLKVDARTVWF